MFYKAARLCTNLARGKQKKLLILIPTIVYNVHKTTHEQKYEMKVLNNNDHYSFATQERNE